MEKLHRDAVRGAEDEHIALVYGAARKGHPAPQDESAGDGLPYAVLRVKTKAAAFAAALREAVVRSFAVAERYPLRGG